MKTINRIVQYDTVLGLHDKCFKLTKGEVLNVSTERDVYGRYSAIIQGQCIMINKSTLERISNFEMEE